MTTTLAHASARLRSLDAFRGLVIFLMFFVNLSGNDLAFPQWFEHAGWNLGNHGQYLADFVFPWFLFIVGCAIPFSMTSGRGRALSTAQRILVAAKRALIIYAFGILIWIAKSANDGVTWSSTGFAPKPGTAVTWSTFLHWDILPLIALGYFLAVCIYHVPSSHRPAPEQQEESPRTWALSRWPWWLFVALVLAGKWLILPNLAATVGLAPNTFPTPRVDANHALRTMSLLGGPFDNFLGTAITQGLPAAATVVLGMLAGDWLRASTPPSTAPPAAPAAPTASLSLPPARRLRTALALLAAGIITTILALIWASPALGHSPISKDFFTPTYVLISAGTGAIVLSLFYLLLDVLAIKRWQWLALGAASALAFLALTLLITHAPTDAANMALRATTIALWTLATILALAASVSFAKNRSAPATAPFLTIYGSNAIAIYLISELLWTLVWTHWRVASPAAGAQHAFTALSLWWAVALNPLTTIVTTSDPARLAQALGAWLTSATLITLYFLIAYTLWTKKLFLKV